MRAYTIVVITTVLELWTAEGNLNYASSDQTVLDIKEAHVADQAVQVINATLEDASMVAVGGDEGNEKMTRSGHILKSIFLKKLHSVKRHVVLNVEPDCFVKKLWDASYVHGYVLLYHEEFLSPHISVSKHLQMKVILRAARWSPDFTKWLIVIGDRDHFQNVALQMIKHVAMKSVYLVPNANNTQDMEVLSFLPRFLSGNHCLRRFTGKVAHVNASEHYLKEPFPQSFSGCHLRVGVRDTPPYIFTTEASKVEGPATWTGLEHNILSTVASLLDLEVRYLLLEGNAELAIFNDVADVVMSGRSFSLSYIFGFRGSHTYHFDRKVFFVHAGQRLPAWMSLVLEFKMNTWFLVVAVCVLAAFIMDRRFLVAWAPILETSASSSPPRLRWFFLLYLMHCLFVNTSYKSSLVSKLVYPGYYPSIRSVRELLSIKGLTLCHDGDVSLMAVLSSILFAHGNPHIGTQRALPQSCLEATAGGGFRYTSSVSENVYLYTAPSRMVGGKDPVVPVAEDGVILTENIRMIVSPTFPFLPLIDQILMHLCEGGFVVKWWADIVRKKAERTEQDEDQILTFVHLKPAFLVLLVGYGLSLLSFVAEVLAEPCFKKRKNWYFQRKFETKRTDGVKDQLGSDDGRFTLPHPLN